MRPLLIGGTLGGQGEAVVEHFEIVPGVGVGPVRFGMHPADVQRLLGAPQHVKNDDASHERQSFLGGFMVDFREGRVEFIELAKSEQFRATFHGASLHDLPPEEAVSFVSQYAAYDDADPELGHSFVFLALQLALWRPYVPDPDEPDDDDYSFHAVSVGVGGYFDFMDGRTNA
jgi:hypothetical protein